MTPDDKTPLPAVPDFAPSAALDRGALERVLARAAELQAHSVEPSEGMTEQDLIELGREVGIGAEHVRRALAEERTREGLPDEREDGSELMASWFGPARVSASRIVRGRPETLLAALDEWMQKQESMQSLRRRVDRLTWEPRRDFLGNLQRGFNFRGRPYELVGTTEVAATAAALDAERVLVRLDADVSGGRRGSAIGSGVLAGGGLTTAGGMVGLATLFPEGSILIGGVVGTVWAGLGMLAAAGVARGQRRKVSRTQSALEQILDRLERDEIRVTSSSLFDFLVPRSR